MMNTVLEIINRLRKRLFFMNVHTVSAFLRKNAVLVIAMMLAAISALIVTPDALYASYYDLKTLCCLFVTLAVVCALKNIHFFY